MAAYLSRHEQEELEADLSSQIEGIDRRTEHLVAQAEAATRPQSANNRGMYRDLKNK